MKQRDLSVDYAKGIAILFVYLGHSVLYYPIDLASMYSWCHVLERMIASFNLPMFFLISGLLFGFSRKPWREVAVDKFKRLFIPYLFTMFCVIVSKMMLPSSMAYNDNQGAGILYNVFVEGGDRWFVYVLMWIFAIALPLRRIVKTSWFWFVVAVPVLLSMSHLLPSVFLLDLTMKYIPFFLLGMYMSQYFQKLKDYLRGYVLYCLVFFVVLNIIFVTRLSRVPVIWDILLPLVGTVFFMGIAVLMEDRCISKSENTFFRFISYSGKYSLQFYLFSFAYPVIRLVVVSILQIHHPFAIVALVFFGQLIAIMVIIEITRRIRFLRIPMGY